MDSLDPVPARPPLQGGRALFNMVLAFLLLVGLIPAMCAPATSAVATETEGVPVMFHFKDSAGETIDFASITAPYDLQEGHIVATVDEGIELRNAGLREPILMLAEPPAQAIPLLLYYNIMPAVYTSEFAIAYAEAADAQGLKAPYHLAINSGMNRIGVHYDSAVEFLHQVSFHRALELKGCFTHFATADSLETLDFQIQIKRFVEAMRSIEAAGFDPGIVHCDNSAATYRFPKTHFDMCRLGISMYGYQAAPDTHKLIDLRPAMSVHARITNVMTVPMSEGVSYGMNYRSPGSVKICTVPIGYADGLIRLLSGKIDFAFNDRAVHQVGNICMDQCMFEVDLRSRVSAPTLDPHIGDEVIIAGPHPTVDCSITTMAKRAATIEHEVTIGFSHRMPRYYR